MISVDLKALVGKLDSTAKNGLEQAVGLAVSRTHYDVEIEHWLLKLVEQPGSDVSLLLRHYGVDASRVTRELTQTLDRLKTGHGRAPSLSPSVVDLARAAWLLASIEFGESKTRSGHLLCALMSDDALARQARDSAPELAALEPETLRREFATVTARSEEADETAMGEPLDTAAPGMPGKPSKTPALDQYTTDLTAAAKAGKLDPVLGRESEVRQIVDILTRRRQNNPILTGEAGVGKTAVVEGFALRIAEGDVPPALRNVSIKSLDLALLQAGAGVRGEFENRLKSVINEVKSSPSPIVLFIDEAHTMVGAGAQAGQGDAANILKPALARGEVRTIAATTWAEYKKYFERDAALARRFQVIKIEEPEEKPAIDMMRGIADVLEAHHHVRILDEALIESVRLSNRYISGRQLPDKSVSLLDTACAHVGVGHSGVPPVIEDARRRLSQLDVTVGILEREEATGADHGERLAELNEDKASTAAELEALDARWKTEKDLVGRIRSARARLEGRPDLAAEETGVETPAEPTAEPTAGAEVDSEKAGEETQDTASESPDALREQLAALNGELDALQGEAPLLHVCVDGQAIAHVVSEWTGIPVGRMVSDEINAVLHLKDRMAESIVGQDHALEAIAQRIQTARANLSDPRTPIGVFLLAGSSGVGKTETGITLANLLYGGEQNMTVINMSEFKEEHKVSLLMGSPPGYVGYGEGGVLTEAVRRKPYSVLLLDEVEKAHPGVQDIFYQVFDKGTLRDGEGRDIDFKNTVILMTTNAGTDTITSLCADPETTPEPEALADALREELLNTFKPAFLGRLISVPYYPLSDEVMARIIKLKLGKVQGRIREAYRAELTYGAEVVQHINDRCTEVATGARNVDHILTRTLLPELSAEFLARAARQESIRSVQVSVDSAGAFAYQIE